MICTKLTLKRLLYFFVITSLQNPIVTISKNASLFIPWLDSTKPEACSIRILKIQINILFQFEQ